MRLACHWFFFFNKSHYISGALSFKAMTLEEWMISSHMWQLHRIFLKLPLMLPLELAYIRPPENGSLFYNHTTFKGSESANSALSFSLLPFSSDQKKNQIQPQRMNFYYIRQSKEWPATLEAICIESSLSYFTNHRK